MRRLFYMFLLSACICQTLPAQEDQNDISCRSDQKKNAAYKKKLWDGYEISLGPVRDQEETEFRCTAAIYNSSGRVVFRTSGFNVTFDENLTGKTLMETANRMWSSERTGVVETIAAGATSCTPFRQSRTSCLKFPWKPAWILKKTRTGKR